MSYATSTQIQAEFKNITFSTTTAVTTAEITSFLADADAEINSRLAVKYLTPITGTESLIMVAMIEVWLVKHRVLDILKVKTGDQKTSQTGGSSEKTYRQMALDLLSDLAKGVVLLTDATLATPADGVRSYTNDNLTDVNSQNVFQRGVNQW